MARDSELDPGSGPGSGIRRSWWSSGAPLPVVTRSALLSFGLFFLLCAVQWMINREYEAMLLSHRLGQQYLVGGVVLLLAYVGVTFVIAASVNSRSHADGGPRKGLDLILNVIAALLFLLPALLVPIVGPALIQITLAFQRMSP